MSEHDDAEFEAFLNRRDAVSKAYAQARDDSGVPPALDAEVLALARRAAPPQRSRRSYRLPLAMAAVVVLSFSAVLSLRESGELDRAWLTKPATESLRAARIASSAEAPVAMPPMAAEPAELAQKSMQAAKPRPLRRLPANVAKQEIAEDASMLTTAREGEADLAAAESAQGGAAAGRVAAERRAADQAPPQFAPAAAVAAAAPAPAPATKCLSEFWVDADGRKVPASRLYPESWIAQISKLQQTQQAALAREQLACFVARYGDAQVPEGLRPLLKSP